MPTNTHFVLCYEHSDCVITDSGMHVDNRLQIPVGDGLYDLGPGAYRVLRENFKDLLWRDDKNTKEPQQPSREDISET